VQKLTLDTNCIIALENAEPAADPLVALTRAHNQGKVELALVGVSASERQRNDRFISNYGEFTSRVEASGLGDLQILACPAYWNISFWGVGLLTDQAMVAREAEIHEALFPNIPFAWPDFAAAADLSVDDHTSAKAKPWRNAFCDRQMFWAHDYYQRDIFVTSDANFKKRLSRHPTFGQARVHTPEEVVALLSP